MYRRFPEQALQQQKKVHGMRLCWSSGPETPHLMLFISANDLARAALSHIEPASTKRAVVHAGSLGVCFGHDSGMIRAAYTPLEFRTPLTCFLRACPLARI